MNQTGLQMPVEIGRANQHDVKIRWQDGHESVYLARELRLACPCAGCVDEMTGQVRVIATSIAQNVYPVKIDLIGRYAISIQWSDGHNTGIYTFEHLRKLDKHEAHSSKQ
jgi:ATP-binding protein involved in chromosome partitioning